ncbi:Uncharacterised protein [Streptococcus dysgalactiae subsp. equisimilis]|nr:Uncharacterised protein [Streptococcus dysgalactiae subsp. equisimilis]
MPIELKHCFVFTGAPGTGKTSLLEALRRHGQRCVGEAGRAIIRQQLANRGDALPWANAEAFKTLMLEQALATWQAHRETAGPVFFDRGIVDVLGYARLSRLDEPPRAARSGERPALQPPGVHRPGLGGDLSQRYRAPPGFRRSPAHRTGDARSLCGVGLSVAGTAQSRHRRAPGVRPRPPRDGLRLSPPHALPPAPPAPDPASPAAGSCWREPPAA